jgi:hypothetical protein
LAELPAGYGNAVSLKMRASNFYIATFFIIGIN